MNAPRHAARPRSPTTTDRIGRPVRLVVSDAAINAIVMSALILSDDILLSESSDAEIRGVRRPDYFAASMSCNFSILL